MLCHHESTRPTLNETSLDTDAVASTSTGLTGRRWQFCVVINYEEGSEASYAADDGRNEIQPEFTYPSVPVRDLGVASLFEYGSRAGIWRLQRLVDSIDIPVTIQGCAEGESRNTIMSIGMHARNMDQPSRAHVLREFLQYAQSLEGTWFARRVDIARW